MTFIAELFREATSIEVRTTFAVFVNQAAIGEGRTVFRIQLRRFAPGDDMGDGRQEVMRVRRAARNVDDGFTWQNFLQANRTGRVHASSGNPPPCGTGTDSDNRCRTFCRFADMIHNRLTGNHAVNTVIF